MNLLVCNLSAGIMIALTLVIRRFAKNKIPNGVFCLLWFMIGIRPLFPASFRTHWSFLNFCIHFRNKLVPLKDLQGRLLDSSMMKQVEIVRMMTEVHGGILFLVWLVGCTIVASHFTRSYLQLWKETNEAKPLKNAEWLETCIKEQKINRKILLRTKYGIDSPVTWGIFHPAIYFPTDFDMENKSVTRMVLLHECGHIKYFHSVFKLFSMILACIYWYNPIVWVMFFKFERDLEISADRYALRHVKSDAREQYADYLIALVTKMKLKQEKNGENRKKITFYHMFYHFNRRKSKKDEHERVEAIMNFKKMGACAVAATLLIPMGMTTVFATTNTVLSMEETDGIIQDNAVIDINVTAIEQDETIEAQPVSISVDWKDIESYIVFDNMERASYLVLENYKYTTYGSIPPKSITITTDFEGHTYKGTLTRTAYNYYDATDEYVGYYAGKIYRQ